MRTTEDEPADGGRGRWSRRRRGVVTGIGVVAVLGLLTPATIVRTQQHDAKDLGATAHVTPSSTRTDHVTVGDRTYIRGAAGLVVVHHESASATTLALQGGGGADVDVLVGPDGGVLTVDGSRAQFRSEGDEGVWELSPSGAEADSLQPLALDGGTALLQRGCHDTDTCEVIGVRDGEISWRRTIDDDPAPVRAPGSGILNLRSDPALVRAPTVAAATRDGTAITIDAHGQVTASSTEVATAQGGSGFVVVEDDVFVIDGSGPEGKCEVRTLTGADDGGWSSSPFACPGRYPGRTITGRTLYSYDRAASGAASPTDVVAVDLGTGATTPLPQTPGHLGMGPDALVSGEDATYRARSTAGRDLWTKEPPFAVPDDRPRGTGLASASEDTAAVWSRPTTAWQVLTLSGATQRVTLLDLESGEVLRRWVGDAGVEDVIALPDHRALIVDGDGRVLLLEE